ncbi:MAG TPA: glycosyl transferase family protein [Novosphingobium sp.]|nr:glycosyl transferase family protein [Novosphingobium sp.]
MAWGGDALVTAPLAATALAAGVLPLLQAVQYELTLFAGFWFIVGMVDELAVDAIWGWLLLRGRVRSHRLNDGLAGRELAGEAAVFIPAWQEAGVIGATVSHALKAWTQAELRLYVGCYRNDPATIAAVMAAAGDDARLRLVVHDRDGPTTKADCLNRLYGALCEDELRSGRRARSVVLHDAEDMVHPAALFVLDAALHEASFVQLPVRPEPQPRSRWVAGHYGDEFTESHAKAMVVRDALGAALPAAGVGCAIARNVLTDLARERKTELAREQGVILSRQAGPFASECLTEDYEMGWRIARGGHRARFLRLRDGAGQLIATRSYFPDAIDAAVRQKARWVHGIAFQGWDRLGWGGRTVDLWMAARDRRGPLVALVLFVAYALIVLGGVLVVAENAGWTRARPQSGVLQVVITLCVAGLLWRMIMRFAFTAREYGWREGLLAVLRIPVANVIAIVAGRRAITAYVRSLAGSAVRWEKTAHHGHPALVRQAGQGA